MSLKIGSVGFINAKPLTYGFEKDEANRHDLIFDTPARLSSKLRSCEIDVGLIPVAEYLQGAGRYIVGGIAITSRGAVGSVFLLRGKDTLDFERVAVDSRSRSSLALLKILLLENGKPIEGFIPYDPRITPPAHLKSDAALIIGDEALVHGRKGYAIDLGEWWTEHTGLPFVYAFWASNVGLQETQVRSFHESKSMGIENLDAIIEKESKNNGIEEDILHDYLTSKITYELGEKEIMGIHAFQNLLRKHRLIESTREITII